MYDKILNKITQIIKSNGIPIYVRDWKPPPIPDNFSSYDEFRKFVNKYVGSYHFHTFVQTQFPASYKLVLDDEMPMPEFTYDETLEIGTVKLQHFYGVYNKPHLMKTLKRSELIVSTVRNKVGSWKLRGLIIDLRKHLGGDMWVGIRALQDIFGDTTILSFGNVKTKRTDKKWINMRNGEIEWNKSFLSRKLAFAGPIAVIVSDATTSSGEFICCAFCGRSNVKIFGTSKYTNGRLSVNKGYKINKDAYLILTSALCTTVDGVFRTDERIQVDKITSKPITDAKLWIKTH